MPSVHSPAYRFFLQRLHAARVESGLTQRQVATALREHQSFVSKCESGERRVDVVELSAFARLYRKPLDFFVEHAPTGQALERER